MAAPTSKTEKTTQKAETKNTRTSEKAAAKNEKAAAKAETPKVEETPEVAQATEASKAAETVEQPELSEIPNPDTDDVVEAHEQNVARATAQDAPAMGVPMGAVNEAEPKATENRFSGIYPNNTYPLVEGSLDPVQEMRKQARDEGARTRRVSDDATPRAARPPLVEQFKTNDHAARRAEAEAEAEAEDVVA